MLPDIGEGIGADVRRDLACYFSLVTELLKLCVTGRCAQVKALDSSFRWNDGGLGWGIEACLDGLLILLEFFSEKRIVTVLRRPRSSLCR